MSARKPRVVKKSNHQNGRTHRVPDKRVVAMLPGVRVSSSGKKYGEYRRNRSDMSRKRRL